MREFNITGVCVPRKHYMVDISEKLSKIIKLIDKEEYFTINRARQYGKTTTLMQIALGIVSKKGTYTAVANKIFEIRIYNYFISIRSTSKGELVTYEYRTKFVNEGMLDVETVLNKFQEVMHDEFREKDARFIEREGRLLFLCFLKPIINGAGFYYVESETRLDNRMDVVVTYGGQQHIIELKIWHGDNYEQDALEQLAGYLDSKRENKGYLISFNFNKNKAYTKVWKKHCGKDIYAIVV